MDIVIKAVRYTAFASDFFPLLVYLYLKNFRRKEINLLAVLCFASILSNTLTIVLYRVFGIGNIVVLNIYDIIQFVLTLLIYYHIYLRKQGATRRFLVSMGIVFIFTNWIFWTDVNSIQSFTWALTSILICAMAFGHYSFLVKYPVRHINYYAPYWISTGVLFYSAFTFTLMACSNIMTKVLDVNNFRIIWALIISATVVFKNVCFMIAIWWASRRNSAWDASTHEN
jgi:hypothetical protein